MKELMKIPKFKSEEEEKEFWANADSTDYLDWDKKALVAFANLKPTTKSISLRLPGAMLDELKTIANKRDVPYQSLIKIILKERIDREYRTSKIN